MSESVDEDVTSAIPSRKRRRHVKSRAGCAHCKRRHIKCDETRPSCASCIAAQLDCPFASQQQQQQQPALDLTPSVSDASRDVGSSSQGRATPARPSPMTPAQPGPETPINLTPDVIDADVNVLHLQLFHHFVTDSCKTLARSEYLDIVRRNLIRCALRDAYLLHQLLAFAAFHISVQGDERASTYAHLATSLQSRALGGLDHALQNVDEQSCLSLLFFSHLLGLHSFCNVFTSRDDGFGDFLEHLIQTVQLLRGVEAVIQPWWDTLFATEIGELMRAGEENRLRAERAESCIPHVYEFFASADISEASRSIYRESLQRLDRALRTFDSDDAPRADVHLAFSWLVTSTQGFADMLAERRPEALVLLAYYAVVLHRRRGSWIIGAAGRRLFLTVQSFLGNAWKPWLAWPAEQILYSSVVNTPA